MIKGRRAAGTDIATGDLASAGKQGLAGLPCSDISDHAVSKRVKQEEWHALAHVFVPFRQILARWLQPALQAFQEKHEQLAPCASELIALAETTQDPRQSSFATPLALPERRSWTVARAMGEPLRCTSPILENHGVPQECEREAPLPFVGSTT